MQEPLRYKLLFYNDLLGKTNRIFSKGCSIRAMPLYFFELKKLKYKGRIRLLPLRPCFPLFFDVLISLGQKGLIILLLKSRPNLGLRSMIPYSPIKPPEFSFQEIKRHYSDTCCCCSQKKPLMRSRILAASMDLFCFHKEDYCLKCRHFATFRSR